MDAFVDTLSGEEFLNPKEVKVFRDTGGDFMIIRQVPGMAFVTSVSVSMTHFVGDKTPRVSFPFIFIHRQQHKPETDMWEPEAMALEIEPLSTTSAKLKVEGNTTSLSPQIVLQQVSSALSDFDKFSNAPSSLRAKLYPNIEDMFDPDDQLEIEGNESYHMMEDMIKRISPIDPLMNPSIEDRSKYILNALRGNIIEKSI